MVQSNRTRFVLFFVMLTLAALACTCGPVSELTSVVQEAQQAAEELQTAGPTFQAALGTVQAEATNMVPTLNALASQGPTLEAALTAVGPTLEAFATSVGENNACELVAGDDVAAATGQTPTSVQNYGPCIYTMPDGGTISIMLIPYQDQAQADGYRSGLASGFPGSVALTGPYDFAIWDNNTASAYGLKGLMGFTVIMSGFNGDRQGVATALCSTLGSRLP